MILRTFLAFLIAAGARSSDSPEPAEKILWFYNNTQWFPYDGTKVLRVVVEEQIFFQCGPSVDMGIASVFLVDQDGFSNCSAAPRYRYDPTNGLTSKYFDSGLFAKHMFYCMGSGNSLSPSIDFTFHGEAQGRSFYLIDVSNRTQFSLMDVANEDEGGRCKYFGMKMRIDVLAATAPKKPPASTSPTPTSTQSTQVNITIGVANTTDGVASNGTESPTATATHISNVTNSVTAQRPKTMSLPSFIDIQTPKPANAKSWSSAAFQPSLSIFQKLQLAIAICFLHWYMKAW